MSKPKQPVMPMMTDEFADTYERFAHRITGPISIAALDQVGVQAGCELLDIAAGAGALSGPAAERGAKVLATDLSPAMVRRLAERLRPFPDCTAAIMNGEALSLRNGAVDAAFSVFGTPFFADFQRGLREQARVVRPGGHGCVVTWRDPPGGGPFVILAEAIKAVARNAEPPSRLEGVSALAKRDRLASEMAAAGFVSVDVTLIEGVWVGRGGHHYLADNAALHRYMPGYAGLSASDRDHVDAKVVELLEAHTRDGAVTLRSAAWVAVGRCR